VALAVCLVAGTFAAGQGNDAPASGKSKKSSSEAVAVRLAEMQKAIEAQQQQIQHLVEQVQNRDSQIQDLQERMNQVQSSASQAQQAAEAATSQNTQAEQNITAIHGDISGLKSTAGDTALTIQEIQETQKNVNETLESPLAVHYKGITITPGGFLAAEFVRRSRALAADVNTPFNSLTMPGASQSSLSEFFGSGRQSRISMLTEGRLQSAKLSGYVEADFLSAGATSNNNESNSYSLRQRQAWGQVALDNGFTFTGGQMWSLVTETNRSEALPMTIDAQYTVGFSWARQYGLRIVKSFHDKAWLAVSVENPQATLTTHNNGDNFLLGSAGASGGLFNAAATSAGANLANYSFNPSPDVIAKLAFEPGFGHYEVFGVYSRFRDRVFPCGEVARSTTLCGSSSVAGPNALGANNASKNGGGIGANARWSFDNKHLDFGLHAFGGSGVGRYGTSGLPDVSIHADGTIDLIKSYQALGTLEWHATKLDVYMNAGAEYAGRAFDFDPTSGKFVGYGSPMFSNTGCFTEIAPTINNGFTPAGLSSCTADTRVLIEGTFGIWFKPYDGSREKLNRGRIQWGPQFSYVDRNTWSGVGVEPHGLDAMIFTSFRYYLP